MSDDDNRAMTAEGPPSLDRAAELLFLPLGGAGEIGMNLNLYHCHGSWLMIDCGVSFGDDTLPAGVDIIMPDPGFIAERRDQLAGLIVTHAHEDHIGAIPYLWPRFGCPIYATPFAAAVLRRKLTDAAGLEHQAKITVVPMSAGPFRVGPFEIELITLTHSIPEPTAVAIRTPLGTVLHTGDWKLDPDPLIGPATDEPMLRCLGDEGVLAMICDSTNALRPGVAGSEADARASLIDLVGHYDNQRVAITCFASNVARLESAALAAAANGRKAALVGRSLWRMDEAARETGYLRDLPPFLTEDEAAALPRHEALLICTGSQGEPGSALARIAADAHPRVRLEEDDVVIFSSRDIPGNERAVGRLQDQLLRRGVQVVTARDHFVHVSGHPARDELTRMYQLVRPRIAVPVHGELRHLVSHAQLARDCGVPETVVAENGDVVRLAPGRAEIIDEVPVGRLAVNGPQIVPLRSATLRDRQHMSANGAAMATVVLTERGKLAAAPQITLQGVLEDGEDLLVDLGADVGRAIDELPRGARRDDAAVKKAAWQAIRRTLRARYGKKPVTEVHIVRV
jgi:ribonuclease J